VRLDQGGASISDRASVNGLCRRRPRYSLRPSLDGPVSSNLDLFAHDTQSEAGGNVVGTVRAAQAEWLLRNLKHHSNALSSLSPPAICTDRAAVALACEVQSSETSANGHREKAPRHSPSRPAPFQSIRYHARETPRPESQP
jgi:hypothetical protein